MRGRVCSDLSPRLYSLFWLATTFTILSNIDVQAALVYATVDDTDPALIYSDQTWVGIDGKDGCTGCLAKVDISKVHDGTYHDTTANRKGGPLSSVSFEFQGSAIYAQAVIPGSDHPEIWSPGCDYYFFIDGKLDGSYTNAFPASAGDGFQYNTTIYKNEGLKEGKHTVVVQAGHSGGPEAILLFDSFIYRFDDGKDPAPVATDSPKSSPSSLSSAAGVTTPSMTSSISPGASGSSANTQSSVTVSGFFSATGSTALDGSTSTGTPSSTSGVVNSTSSPASNSGPGNGTGDSNSLTVILATVIPVIVLFLILVVCILLYRDRHLRARKLAPETRGNPTALTPLSPSRDDLMRASRMDTSTRRGSGVYEDDEWGFTASHSEAVFSDSEGIAPPPYEARWRDNVDRLLGRADTRRTTSSRMTRKGQ